MIRQKSVRLTFAALLLVAPFGVAGQDRASVWKAFYEIVSLPAASQVPRFEQLQKTCIRAGIVQDSTYSNLLNLYASALYFSGNSNKAIRIQSEAISVAKKYPALNPGYYLAKYYFYYGYYIEKSERYDVRIAAYRNAVAAGKNQYDKWGLMSKSYLALAAIYQEMGDYGKARAFSEEGYVYAKAKGDTLAILDCLYEKIFSDYHLHAYSTALRDIDLLLKIARRKAPGANLIRYHKLKGDILAGLRQYPAAKNEYLAATALLRDSTAKEMTGILYSDLHYLSVETRDRALSDKYFKLALDNISDGKYLSRLYCNQAWVHIRENAFENALLNLQLALTSLPGLAFENSNPQFNPKAAAVRNVPMKDYVLTPVLDKADTWLAYAKQTDNDRTKLRNALLTYMLADTIIDYMRWEHTGDTSKLYWRETTRGMYERAIETCYLLHDPAKAFYFFEKSRAVMLNDQLNELSASQLLSPPDQQKETSLKQKVLQLQNELAEHQGSDKAASDIRTRLFAARREQDDFVRQVEQSNPRYYTYKYNAAVPSLAELRSQVLKENQIFISYFAGDSAVYGLAVSADSAVLKKIALPAYQQYVSAFQRLIGDREAQNRRFGDYLRVSSQLYEMLIKPFEMPSATRIIISPDGGFLPFEALSASPASPEYLVRKYAFSYTYSAGFLSKSVRNKGLNIFSRPFLGLAPVQFAPRLSQASLPGSDQVLKTIDQQFFRSKTLSGPAASRNAFLKEFSNYRIVQLLTHATADSSGAVPTLYFADSTLNLNELSVVGMPSTELLVLSACQTGIGKNQRGEGVLSLARGFAGLGIPSTLTTLWRVENESVYTLTELFYQALERKQPLDLALQTAKKNWLQTAGPSGRLPYAWAGMVLVGKVAPVNLGPSRPIVFVLFGGLVVLLVFLFYSSRSRKA